MNEDSNNSEVRAALEYVAKHHKTEVMVSDPLNPNLVVPVLVVGGEVVDLEKQLRAFRQTPDRHEGEAVLYDRDSFVAWTKAYMRPETSVYVHPIISASAVSITFKTVIDGDSQKVAGWRRFTGIFKMALHETFVRWTNAFSREMSQDVIAELLEERALDIVEAKQVPKTSRALQYLEATGLTPALPTEVLNLSKGLELTVSTEVTDAVNLSDGTTRVNFAEKHAGKGGQQLHVPKAFLVALPIFEDDGDTRFVVPVRVRYRLSNGKVMWRLVPHGLTDLVRDAFEVTRQVVEKDLETKLVVGSPPVRR